LTSGNYNVIATDTNGCEVEAVINDVIAGLNSVVSTKEGVKIYPTPVSEKLNIYIDDTKLMAEGTSACAYIYNSLGELVLLSPELLFENAHFEIDVHLLPEGIYFLELGFRESFHRIRFIKQ
jgi:type IX secretion system substrate protein